MDFCCRSRGHQHLLPVLCISAVFIGIPFASVAALGGVSGPRGLVQHTGYDLFAGVPVLFSRPDGFKTTPATFGFNLNMDF